MLTPCGCKRWQLVGVVARDHLASELTTRRCVCIRIVQQAWYCQALSPLVARRPESMHTALHLLTVSACNISVHIWQSSNSAARAASNCSTCLCCGMQCEHAVNLLPSYGHGA